MSRERVRHDVVFVDADGTEHPAEAHTKKVNELATIRPRDRSVEVVDGAGHLLAVVTAALDGAPLLSWAPWPTPAFVVLPDGFHGLMDSGAGTAYSASIHR